MDGISSGVGEVVLEGTMMRVGGRPLFAAATTTTLAAD
jgi:hypothetical protein